MIAVSPDNVASVVKTLDDERVWVVDTETTGLRCYHGDVPFSVAIWAGSTGYYFNFMEYHGQDAVVVDPSVLVHSFSQPRTYIFHNAKFDLRMLANIGLKVPRQSTLYCTMTMERVVNLVDSHVSFSLGDMGKRYGIKKDDAVEKYIEDHGLWEWRETATGGKTKDKFFDQVPYGVIAPYAVRDVEATGGIAVKQMGIVRREVANYSHSNTLDQVKKNEMRLLRTVYDIENRGVLIDEPYCHKALTYETGVYTEARAAFEKCYGKPVDKMGSIVYKEVFRDEQWTLTGKGNPSFSKKVIEGFTGKAATHLNTSRKAKSKIDVYKNLLYHIDDCGVLHTNLNQNIPRTGRFSSSGPNLQNMEKPKKEDLEGLYVVRRAIIPRGSNSFAMLDYEQMEYRMMLDYANAAPLIQKVLGGLDVHQAMADAVGFPRDNVKNANFAILYGAGDQTLSVTLGSSLADAQKLRQAIYKASPEIEQFVDAVKARARNKRRIRNWLGRIYNFNDRSTVFKAVNTLIQGGCADVVKMAMIVIDEMLQDYVTDMVLTIHDEIVLEGPMDELEELIPKVKHIMETVYEPRNGLHLSVSVDVSNTSLADKRVYE